METAPSTPRSHKTLRTVKHSWALVVCVSLLLGIIGIIGSTYVQHHSYWSDTMYGISRCTEQSPGLPNVPNPSAPKTPDLTGCTGVRVGWPATFIASDVQISVGVNNPKQPLTIDELFGFSDLHLNLGTFLADWIVWSATGFVLAYAVMYCRTKKI
ncbi:MAG TPA: hypothetical protein VLF59_02445 [Candidatus Saccharimonadales bacterium]|nr:hypothetical protein [Candidatus Saccharimonadales bacterium]